MIKRGRKAWGWRVCLLQGMLAFSLFAGRSFAQSAVVQITADKKDILIGEQVRVTVRTLFPLHSTSSGCTLIVPDSIAHFELIDKGHAVLINFKDRSTALEQVITLTSFDSGRWTIPALRVVPDPQGSAPGDLYTDSIPVNVTYSPPDSTNEIRDIKPVIEVRVSDYTWYYIAAGLLIFLAGVFLLIRYLRKRKNSPLQQNAGIGSPFDEAMAELEKLWSVTPEGATRIKNYHVRLTDIFRQYLGRKQGKGLQNKTTGELLIVLSAAHVSMEAVSPIAIALRCNDAVKFAKYLPPLVESEDCLIKIKESIQMIERQPTTPN